MVWIVFNLCLLALLLVDLGVFHRKNRVITAQEAFKWVGLWVSLSCLFGVWVFFNMGTTKALEFSAGYLLELSLSMDNVFVFVLIFKRFAVPAKYQYRVLFWGVLGALVMRAAMIFVGIELLNKFYWMVYVFGGFLIITGAKMLFTSPDDEPEGDPFIVKLIKSRFNVTEKFHGQKFFHVEKGVKYITPLFIVLILVEISDLVFALDSIPAIFAITRDPFIVYTSNVFAILGLRSLYFALASMVDRFKGLHYGLSIILVFVGCKMLASQHFHLPVWATIGFIIVVLTTSIVLSFKATAKTKDQK